MTRFDIERGSLLVLLAACNACSARSECDARDEGYNGRPVISTAQAGSLMFSQSGQAETISFASTISGLPKLWPSNSAISSGRFDIGLTLRYATDPVGLWLARQWSLAAALRVTAADLIGDVPGPTLLLIPGAFATITWH